MKNAEKMELYREALRVLDERIDEERRLFLRAESKALAEKYANTGIADGVFDFAMVQSIGYDVRVITINNEDDGIQVTIWNVVDIEEDDEDGKSILQIVETIVKLSPQEASAMSQSIETFLNTPK